MQYVFYFLVLVIILKVLNMAVNPSKQLMKAMVSLGKIKDRNYTDIIKVAGNPTTTQTNNQEGTLRCTWVTQNYEISLGFKDNICIGVLSETKK